MFRLPEKERVVMVTSTNRSNIMSGKLSVEADLDSDIVSGVPTPLQFDAFVPWFCRIWCASNNVLVTRIIQGDYVKYENINRKSKQRRGKRKSAITLLDERRSSIVGVSSSVSAPVLEDTEKEKERVVQMKTVYNNKKKLIEVSITGCPFKISRRIIQAIGLCISFHSFLNRFTFRRGGLSAEIIYEINKLLPRSTLTEFCFDDSYVREGNYYILLENVSQIKYLSLNRCKLTDAVCAKIVSCIEYGGPSADSLKILELGSNEITDVGAKCIGTMLRRNRTLLHLNLSGNRITDKGFEPIIEALKQFDLTPQELRDKKGRRMRYVQNRAMVFEKCLENLKLGKSNDGDSGKKSIFNVKRVHRRTKRTLDDCYIAQAELMTSGIVGEFKDPYIGDENVVLIDGQLCSKGNLVLSSLNVAYNNLKFPSILKVRDVVRYQGEIGKASNETGLVRITLDGNAIPASCIELDDIDVCLTEILNDVAHAPRKTRTSSFLRKMMARKS
ncbi:unnamed protein product [Chrysodeixis includens]|uniref:Leucine rich repeat protein n=1 Tax=Chrysodeixis includens TaxID=689277 RepID=A0A9P0BX16_CHRIL|nr:unnamed protein product [Chrysodeixis includens]